MDDKNVTIYSTPTCHFCEQVKEFLKGHGISYTEYNVAEDSEKRQEMVQRTGQMGVPVTVIGQDIVIGFNEGKLKELLEVS